MENLPNFLIVGAQKAGTTSVYHYLNQHNDIYMSPIKEPRFFSSQILKLPLKGPKDKTFELNMVKTFSNYKTLFKKVKHEKAIGEASVENLFYHKEVIPLIKKYLGDPKIIICLRDPIERAFSAYNHLIREGREFLLFEDALKEEKNRMKKNWEYSWFYYSGGLYYNQVRDYIENFSQVKVIFIDELEKNSEKVIKELYTFLEVDESFKPNTKTKYNTSYTPKISIINYLLAKQNPIKTSLKKIARKLGLYNSLETLGNKIILSSSKKNNLIDSKTYHNLKKLYQSDQDKLNKFIKNNWKK